MIILIVVISVISLLILVAVIGTILYSAWYSTEERVKLTSTIAAHADTLGELREQCRTEESQLRSLTEGTLEVVHREHA